MFGKRKIPNQFSREVKETISFSMEEALRLGNDFISPEHLFLGLIREGNNASVRILRSFNVDLNQLRKQVETSVKDNTGKNTANIVRLPLTEEAEQVIRITASEAKQLKSLKIETEHIMLSILRNKENPVAQILNHFNVNYDMFKEKALAG